LLTAFPGRKAVAAAPICEHQIGQMPGYEIRSRTRTKDSQKIAT
jgi:hypothetical protein